MQPALSTVAVRLISIAFLLVCLDCSDVHRNHGQHIPQSSEHVLSNVTLDIVTIHRPPFTLLTLSEDGSSILGVDGFCFQMIRMLQQIYQFRYRLHQSYDGNWGSLLSNGTWNGMVGMVNRSEVDMAVSCFTISAARERGIDFTISFYEDPSSILLPAPRSGRQLMAIVRPFSWPVWIGILLVTCAVSWTLCFVGQYGSEWIPKCYPHRERASLDFSGAVWYIGACLLSQGGRSVPANLSVRLLVSFWWFLAITITASYTGSLVAFLTLPSVSQPIGSLQDLSLQDKLRWTYRRYTVHDSLFTTSPAAVYRKIASRRSVVTSDREGIDRVLTGTWAFIKEKSYLEFALEQDFQESEKCRLTLARNDFFVANYGWVLRTDSPYLHIFNTEMLRMSAYGFFAKWKRQYWPQSPSCDGGSLFMDATSLRALSPTDLHSPLLMYGVGVSAALIAFLLERAVAAAHRPRAPEDAQMSAAEEPWTAEAWLD